MNCKICGEYVDVLDMFPNDMCVDCYATTAEANYPITALQLAQMWGAK